MKIICIDLETTGVDVETCEVVQVGGIEVYPRDPKWVGPTKSMLCGTLHPIPASATGVHGITDADVAGISHFGSYAQSVIDWLDTADIVVTFNGGSFDLPVIARHTPDKYTGSWRPKRHIDVFRLFQLHKRLDVRGPWTIGVDSPMTAGVMSGSLQAAHTFWCGKMFDGAHDALADCQATLDTLHAMTKYDDKLTLDCAVELTAQPLPGDVDWSGKLKWDGDEVVFAFGKHKGKPVSGELGARGYVRWMLDKGDFPEDTCDILRKMQYGEFPKREET